MKLLRLTFLLAIGSIAVLCNAESEIEAEISEIQQAIADHRAEYGDPKALEQSIQSSKGEIEKKKASLLALEKEIERQEKFRDIYRSSFRVVTALQPESQLGTISLEDNSVVADAVYTGADGGGIFVRTPTGARSISAELLPEAIYSQFNFPPNYVDEDISLREVISMKPDIIREEEPMIAGPGSGSAEKKLGSGKAKASQPAPNEDDGKEKRNNARLARIEQLRARFTEVSEMKNIAVREKASVRSDFRKLKIQKSAKEIDKAMDIYELKINGLKLEEDKIRKEIDRIRGDWE